MAEKVYAEIVYKRLGRDKILILGFKNFMGSDDIRKKYGDLVCDIYLNNAPSMIINGVGNCLDIRSPFDEDYHVGEEIDRKYFAKAVSDMKSCGKALNEAIKMASEVKVEDVKSVTI